MVMTLATPPTTSSAPSTALDTTESIYTVSIKLPLFYKEDPTRWYDWAEAQFGIFKITDVDTKYWHVWASLDAETSSHTPWTCHQ